MSINAVRARTVTGTWYRHTPLPTGGQSVDPLWYPPRTASARWQQGDVVAALYLADSIDTMTAEWYRWLAELGAPPTGRRLIWQYDLHLGNVADLGSRDRIRSCGLRWPLPPDSTSWPEYQHVGHRLHAAGFAGIYAPSAARAGSARILTIFRTTPDTPLGLSTPPRHVGELDAPAPPRGLRT